MLELRIRHARASDEVFIGALARECFAEYDPHPERNTLSMVARGTTLVAEAGPRLIAFAVLEFSSRQVAHLAAIAVDYSCRGRGVGRQLLRAAEEFAGGRGATRLELVTADSNLAALDLFYKAGFGLRQRRNSYYAHGQQGYALSKPLSSPR